MKNVENTSVCLFDLTPICSLLMTVLFNFYSNIDQEKYCHSFIGKLLVDDELCHAYVNICRVQCFTSSMILM